jgi:hypothetical protein
MSEDRFVMGCDLGTSMDFTAVCVSQVERNDEQRPILTVRHLERYINKPYPRVVSSVYGLMLTPPLRGAVELVIDATGVGKAVGHMFDERGVKHKKVWIHGGQHESYDKQERQYSVPKVELISHLSVLFHDERFRIEKDIELAEVLATELQGMQRRQNENTGHQTFIHREGEHDDLVLAAALTAWYAKRFGGMASIPVTGGGDSFFGGDEMPFPDYVEGFAGF